MIWGSRNCMLSLWAKREYSGGPVALHCLGRHHIGTRLANSQNHVLWIFIHSHIPQTLSTCYVSHAVLRAEDTVVNGTDTSLAARILAFIQGLRRGTGEKEADSEADEEEKIGGRARLRWVLTDQHLMHIHTTEYCTARKNAQRHAVWSNFRGKKLCSAKQRKGKHTWWFHLYEKFKNRQNWPMVIKVRITVSYGSWHWLGWGMRQPTGVLECTTYGSGGLNNQSQNCVTSSGMTA